MPYLANPTEDRSIVFICSIIHLFHRHAGRDFEGWSLVSRSIERRKILNVLQIVSPDGQGPGPAGLPEVAVSCVLDDEPNVQIPRKVDGKLDLSDGASIDRVDGKPAHGAISVRPVLRHARQALKEREHDRGWVLLAVESSASVHPPPT